jgi:hypothetical protein
MPERITSLLADLQQLVEQISNGNNKREGPPVQDEPGTSEPARALSENPADKKFGDVEDLIVDADGQVAGVVIGVNAETSSATALERVEVKPEPEGRVRITVLARRDQRSARK